MEVAGRDGRAVGRDYLLNRWSHGLDAGIYRNNDEVLEAAEIWAMSPETRRVKFDRWKDELLNEHAERLYKIGKEYNDCLAEVGKVFSQTDGLVLREKRIIG